MTFSKFLKIFSFFENRYDKLKKQNAFQGDLQVAKELKQDLNGTEQHPGMVFIMFLLMEEKCDMPDKNYMQSIMNKHLGETDCFAHNTESAGFAPHRYTVHFEKENKDAHPFLMVTSCSAIEKPLLGLSVKL